MSADVPEQWRTMLADAYSFVRSREALKAVSALTLDHLIQEQIELIQGGDSRALLDASGLPSSVLGSRVSKLEALNQIERGIDDLVAAVQKTEGV